MGGEKVDKQMPLNNCLLSNLIWTQTIRFMGWKLKKGLRQNMITEHRRHLSPTSATGHSLDNKGHLDWDQVFDWQLDVLLTFVSIALFIRNHIQHKKTSNNCFLLNPLYTTLPILTEHFTTIELGVFGVCFVCCCLNAHNTFDESN